MNKKVKWFLFGVGILLFMYLLKYQFLNSQSFESWNLPLSGKIIYLDPGHGGPDGGAGDEEVLEKDIALSVALKLRDYLQEQGALVLLTRETDTDLADEETRGYSRRKVEDLQKRLQLINESDASLYLSIHLNAIPSSRWSGAQTFYYPRYKENRRIATFIQEELRVSLENTDRLAKVINNVYLIKNAKKPGALVEIGFLSNPEEKRNLMNDRYQDKVAEAIYRGVLRYFTNEPELEE
ncbi:N-acetylmuramoyl-L-alanine amidase CwlD [Aeribacillus pallidus]|jgi:N-acetylmuramoyl-L-alanine amidase|uniref:N-acetylmuramoyl-L-alanine amidase CwlD n=1 Tax=Aeribacillus pallidus TaxID=33936 RepID=UPI001DA6332D|nr:N-acetylmuramoyl-L-alanine amidase CwlD [Bacillus sp. (in: firmicutes)]